MRCMDQIYVYACALKLDRYSSSTDWKAIEMCSFESLPNEIILLVFEYLSLFDLYQAFYHLINTRLVRLLFAKRHSLVTGSLRCEQMCRLLHESNLSHLQCLTNLIETLVLDDPYATTPFLQSVTPHMAKTQPFNLRFPSLKYLLIIKANHYSGGLIRSLLLSMNFCNHPLQRVHLLFEGPSDSYSCILYNLVSSRISFPTMILEVENGE